MPRGRSRVLLCFRERLRLFSLWSEDVKIQSNMQPCTTRFFWTWLKCTFWTHCGGWQWLRKFQSQKMSKAIFSGIECGSDLAECACVYACLHNVAHSLAAIPFSLIQNMGYLLRHHFPTASSTERHDMIMLCSSKVSSLQLWKSWKILLICQRFDRCSFLDWDGY